MAKPITYAVRVTLDSGREVFLRRGGVCGGGPITTFRTKDAADAAARAIAQAPVSPPYKAVVAIERSHGRQTCGGGISGASDRSKG